MTILGAWNMMVSCNTYMEALEAQKLILQDRELKRLNSFDRLVLESVCQKEVYIILEETSLCISDVQEMFIQAVPVE